MNGSRPTRFYFDSYYAPSFSSNAASVTSGALRVRSDQQLYRNLNAMVVIGYGADFESLCDEIQDGVTRYAAKHNSRFTATAGKEGRIRQMREENDRQSERSQPPVYSRSCEICLTAHPVARAVLVECGHTLCMACALQIEKSGRIQCPFCRKLTTFVQLREDKVDDEREKIKNNKGKEKIEVATGLPTKGKCVYVGNLPRDTEEYALHRLMSTAGNVTKIRLISDRETGRFKGFGFCQFSDEISAIKATTELNGAAFLGRNIRVSIAKGRDGQD